MSTYSGGLTEAGLPALVDEGEVVEPSLTLHRIARVVLTDELGNVVPSAGANPAPGSSLDAPAFVANYDGDNFRVRLERSSVKITDGMETADVLDLVAAKPLAVAVLDAAGVQITNFGGSAGLTDTQLRASPVPVSVASVIVTEVIPGTLPADLGKAFITTSYSASDTGVAAAAVHRAAGTALTSTPNQYVPLTTDMLEHVWKSGSHVDGAAFIAGSHSSDIDGALVDEVSPGSVIEGATGALRMSPRRELYTQIRSGDGNERGVFVDAIGQMAVRINWDDAPATPETQIVAVDGTVMTVPKLATYAAEAALIVSTAAVCLARANAGRLSLLISNTGTGSLFIGNTSAVTASGAGLGRKVPTGQSFSDSGFGVWPGERWGIYDAVASAQNCSVSELS